MKKQLLPILILLLAPGLTGCGGESLSSTSEDASSSGNEGSSSSISSSDNTSSVNDSSPSSSIDTTKIDQLLADLHRDEVAAVGNFDIMFYTAGTETLISESTTWQETIISPDYSYIAMEENGTLSESEYYRSEEGYVVVRTLLPTNQVVETPVQNDGSYIPFDDFFYNFFEFIEAGDCLLQEDGSILVEGLSEADKYELVYGLTFYQDIPFVSLEFSYEEDGSLRGLLRGAEEGVEVSTASGTIIVDMECSYAFEVMTPEEAGFEPILPLPTQEGHDQLTALFASLQAGNYTLDIVRTGGIDGGGNPQRWYMNDTSIVRVYLSKDLSAVTTGYGYIATEGGLDYVSYENGKLNGGETLHDGELSELKCPFLFAAEAFDVKGNDTYVLKTGYDFEGYVSATLPDAAGGWDNQYYMNIEEGSLKIEINDDGTAIFSYSYSYLDYGNTITGTVTVTVSEIGTTEVPYEYVPWTEPDYGDWSSYGEAAVEIIGEYMGADASLFPVLDPLAAKTYKASITDNYNGRFLSITNTYADEATATAAYETYMVQLTEKGWESDPNYDAKTGRYVHAMGTGNGYYHLSCTTSGKYVYLKLYQPTTSLTDWYARSFGEQYACWMSYSVTTNTYDLVDGTPAAEPTSTSTSTKIHKIKNGAIQETVNGVAGTVFYEDTANDRFVILGKGSDNTWAPITYYDGLDDYNLESYAGNFYIMPGSLSEYLGTYFVPAEGDGVYNAVAAALPNIAYLLFGETVSDAATGTLTMDYYDNLVTLTIVDQVVEGSTMTETVMSLEISHIGHQVSFTVPSFSYGE